MDCKILGEAKVVSLGDNNLYDDDLSDVQKGAPLGIAVVNVIYALGNEMKVHAGHIYTVAIESSDDVSLTTKISIKAKIDKLNNPIDAYEQVMNKQSNNKKGADDGER